MEENTTPAGTADGASAPPGPQPTHGQGQGQGHSQSQGQHGPRVSWEQIQDTSRLSRPQARIFTGVAAGVARHLDVDPLLIRILFVVLSFFGGAGLLLYGGLWLLLPEDGSERAALHLDARNRRIAVIAALAIAAVAAVGTADSVIWAFWPLALAALVVWLLVVRKEPTSAPNHGWQYGPSQPTSQPTSASGTAPAPAPGGVPGGVPFEATATDTNLTPVASAPWTLPVPAPAPAWTPTTPQAGLPLAPHPAPPQAPKPRPAGPALFWTTAALIALGVGILGMVDVAGVSVLPSAYPALALAITAVMLVVGAFWGRATGLIALGLVAGLVTLASMSGEQWTNDGARLTPLAATDVPDHHEFRNGRLVLDLTEVTDLEALSGRTVKITGGVGAINVYVPRGLALRTTAEVGGPGSIDVLGEQFGGIALEHTSTDTSGDTVGLLTLDLELGLGTITVTRDDGPLPGPSSSPESDLSEAPVPSSPARSGPTSPAPGSITLDPEAGAQR